MNCFDYIDMLSDYIDDELEPGDKKSFDSHFADCPDCRVFLKSFRSTVEAIEYLKKEQCPPALENKLKSLIQTRIKILKP